MSSGKKKDFRVNSALHPEYQQPGLHITMDSNGVNTNYSVLQNYVTIITDLTKNCGISIGRIEGGMVAERRRQQEPKLLSQESRDKVKLIYLKIVVKT